MHTFEAVSAHLEVGHGLLDLFSAGHHKWAHLNDWLIERFARDKDESRRTIDGLEGDTILVSFGREDAGVELWLGHRFGSRAELDGALEDVGEGGPTRWDGLEDRGAGVERDVEIPAAALRIESAVSRLTARRRVVRNDLHRV